MDARLEAAGLTKRELAAITLYMERCLLPDIAAHLAVEFGGKEISKSGVCHLIKRALAKLRAAGITVDPMGARNVERNERLFVPWRNKKLREAEQRLSRLRAEAIEKPDQPALREAIEEAERLVSSLQFAKPVCAGVTFVQVHPQTLDGVKPEGWWPEGE